MRKIDCHLQKRALLGGEEECGDNGLIRVTGNNCFMALIDALGHGKAAHEVAMQALTYLSTRSDLNLIRLLEGLHQSLIGTRGAVAGVCRLHLDTGILDYAGVGNISMKIFAPGSRRLVIRDGVLGYRIRSLDQQKTRLVPGNIFLMNSDGIRNHFDPADMPDILLGSARDIARAFIERLGKINDDASCLVLRYGI